MYSYRIQWTSQELTKTKRNKNVNIQVKKILSFISSNLDRDGRQRLPSLVYKRQYNRRLTLSARLQSSSGMQFQTNGNTPATIFNFFSLQVNFEQTLETYLAILITSHYCSVNMEGDLNDRPYLTLSQTKHINAGRQKYKVAVQRLTFMIFN